MWATFSPAASMLASAALLPEVVDAAAESWSDCAASPSHGRALGCAAASAVPLLRSSGGSSTGLGSQSGSGVACRPSGGCEACTARQLGCLSWEPASSNAVKTAASLGGLTADSSLRTRPRNGCKRNDAQQRPSPCTPHWQHGSGVAGPLDRVGSLGPARQSADCTAQSSTQTTVKVLPTS